MIVVQSARAAAKVPYPNAYASAAEAAESKEKYLFNCAQRAHANYLESLPTFLVSLFVAGLKYPVWSAGLGAAWCVMRVLYGIGYLRTDKPKGTGRYAGILHTPIALAMGLLGGWAGWQVLVGK